MPAKSFLGAIGAKAHGWYLTAMRDEVPDTTVRGYLNAASQIADSWQQADTQLAALQSQGVAPWDAYTQLQCPLAFIRAARTYHVFAQQLIEISAAADPSHAGYLPHITYDQVDALCHRIQPLMQQAVASLSDPTYTSAMALPIPLEPRVEAPGHVCPLPHLQGMIAAAREIRGWASGLIAQYEEAVNHASSPAPAPITAHLTVLHRHLAEADSQLHFGTDLVGQVFQGEAIPQLHEDAENHLWNVLAAYCLLNQVVAIPCWQDSPTPTLESARQATHHDQRIRPDDLWRVAAPSARGFAGHTIWHQ